MIRPAIPPLCMALAALCLSACGEPPEAGTSKAGTSEAETAPAFQGRVLAEAIPRPDFTLLDTSGEPYAFLDATRGKTALLFFGYTHCPDVCPVHMGNIAAVLDDLPYDRRREVEVVFVSTDPARDTAPRIRAWLDRFDTGFVGLRGERAVVDSIQRSLGLPASVVEPPAGDGSYAVGHAAQVLAFSPDGPARVVYPFGTRQADWAHDLPLLVSGTIPGR